VLQVNFRGSSGYGARFAEAGHRQLGGSIEDDIDAVMRKALAEYPLDADRICFVGTSYGGYSSLVAALRWPDRVRCAVSIAGASDRQLVFSASDSARSPEVRKRMLEIFGDPEKDAEMMHRNSPLYRYSELEPKIMLVHGLEDLRVDFEHTRRLLRMLNLAKHHPVFIQLEDEGHGVNSIKNRELAWGAIAGFLKANLSADAKFPPRGK
jgi:dipeptidyl aminopeptidase/acylaminoacyl peptidase